MKVKIYAAAAILCGVVLFYSGCQEETPEDDLGIGEITIYNIPQSMNLFEAESVKKDSFKIYINASNSQNDQDIHEAQGTVQFLNALRMDEREKAVLKDGKWEITVPLYKPDSNDSLDPDDHGDAWFGEARYFSIVLSPKDVTSGVDAIWIKAGMTLNKWKARLNWDSLIDFRALKKTDLWGDASMQYGKKEERLYNAVVCKDDAIIK